MRDEEVLIMEPQQTHEDPERIEPGEDRDRDRDPRSPTATAPDSVDASVPTADQAGQVGPDAADPPRAAGKHEEDAHGDAELDPDEGADVFETETDAKEGARTSEAERQDEDHISIDPPD
ncbi:hypothetical protein [Leucobacter celer]|uniref:hypothetical protein n=1 Tax=Leucobacter celer TaxID=668625 RepID=UPI0006A7C3DB|nr:hypothetical protein [Leucobacter celer]